jgi:hypothetical protein
LLVKGDVSREGDVDMAVRREEGDQRQQAADDEGDPALNIEDKNPTHAEPSLLNL